MKKLGKGPELKVPAFLEDLYYDLRDRRLLPLVALVLVAIFAVPFLLGGKGGQVPVVPPAAVASGAAEASGAKSSLTVVEATPGLRDYHKRLRDRSPTDPFEQRYTGPAGGGSSSSGDAVASSSEGSSPSGTFNEETITTESSSTSVSVEASGGGGSHNGGGSNGGSSHGANSGSGGKPHLTVFDYAIDARISHSPPEGQDGGRSQKPFVEHRVLPQTPLPGEKAPVVTYMGPGRKAGDRATGKILLLVSGDVSSISGERRCVSSRAGGICQLLEVEPGFPLTFAYGEGGAHYTIKVLKIELVVTGHS